VCITAVAVSGCASTSPVAAGPGNPAPETTAIAAASGCTKDNPQADDVIGLEDVTDEFGTYCHVTYDPASANLTWDASIVDASVEENGFTAAEARAARDAALTFVVEIALDSSTFDNPNVDRAQWVADTNLNLGTNAQREIEEAASDPAVLGQYLIGHFIPTASTRTGLPRAQSMSLTVSSITGTATGEGADINTSYLHVNVTSTAIHQGSDDASVVTAILRNHPEKTEEQLRLEAPGLFENLNLGFALGGSFQVHFKKETGTSITGFGTAYTVSTLSDPAAEIYSVDF
jgi:hypothetical protein